MKKYRVWAEIDLDHVAENLRTIRSQAGSDCETLVVVKADAYGHGAVPVARTCLENGADMLGVGDSSEAIHLREHGIRAPILILGAIIEEEIGWVVSHGIRPTLHSPDMVDVISNEAERQGTHLPVHMKVDTGMRRLGARPETALNMAKRIKSDNNLKLEGLCTHLSSAYSEGTDGRFTEQQLRRFRSFIDRCEEHNISFERIHAANSGAIFMYPNSHFSMVRPGIAVYGIQPGSLAEVDLNLDPALSLHSQITFIKGVEEEKPVGYDRTYSTEERTLVGTVPIGYHDGYQFALSNRSDVLVDGCRCPVIGTVTMDYTLIDLNGVEDPEVGDRVTLIGENGGDRIDVTELSEAADTVPYEITSTLGPRVHRVYL